LIQTGILPIPRENLEEAIRTKTKAAFVDVNLAAFGLGFATAAGS
jgi:indolepyruvate ferredoxin oxidoreductase beta subunit